MLKFNQEKGNCTGCAACYSACPVHCIKMTIDKEGFLYPIEGEGCINCGLCEKVCPSFHEKKDLEIRQKAIAALSKDNNIWRRSASGGAFSEICRHWADKETLIVGAAWDGLKVHHIGVIGFKSIAPLCKSKYVSSAIEDTFIEIRGALKEGRKAIFCGCPCQVAGLKNFLRKDYKNLLAVDFICHGQGSPSVFDECMKVVSQQIGDNVTSYQFRAKRKRYEQDYISYITSSKSSGYYVNDPYIQLFLSQNALRPSCGENCRYRDVRRPGDLTIADFKGLTKVFPDIKYPSKNWSTVVCNTAKGEKVMDLLSETMKVRDCTIDDVIKYNPLFAHQTWFSKDRDSFFKDFLEDEQKAILKWTVPLTKCNYSLLWTAISFLPNRLTEIILKLYHVVSEQVRL